MTKYGLTLSSEEHPPERLVEIAVEAERAGFDFVSISDHFHPWISDQGHSPFVWSVLGAISQATTYIGVAVGVTCPIMRIHPVINAHAVATTARMLEGRFTWGVGTGESLNEHVLGDRWPSADQRIDMLEEAVAVIRELWTGESVTRRGKHYVVEDARLFDLPEDPPILVSAFGESAARLAARIGDGLWTTGVPDTVIDIYREAGGSGPVFSQLSVCWAPSHQEALDRVLRKWPNTALPGQLPQDLRTVEHFEQAVGMLDPKLIRDTPMPLGPMPELIIDSIKKAVARGVDHVYLHQVGDPLDGFIEFWKRELEPGLP